MLAEVFKTAIILQIGAHGRNGVDLGLVTQPGRGLPLLIAEAEMNPNQLGGQIDVLNAGSAHDDAEISAVGAEHDFILAAERQFVLYDRIVLCLVPLQNSFCSIPIGIQLVQICERMIVIVRVAGLILKHIHLHHDNAQKGKRGQSFGFSIRVT